MENKNILMDVLMHALAEEDINKIENFRKQRQTAILTILFSDIVNSTYATEKLGEEIYSNLRYIHDELFKKVMCRDNAGIIIKQIGDSFLCVFAEPSTAVLRSVEFQRAIHANKQHLTGNGYTLTVRIGINLGQVVVENALAMDIFGTHVNRAARIESVAGGGQIITSQSVWENTTGWLKDLDGKNIGWVSYGKIKLKGIEKNVNIYGFYAKELERPKTPKLLLQKRKKNIAAVLAACILVLIACVFVVKKINVLNSHVSEVNKRKTYYVQFDFSSFANNESKFKIDTAALEQDLLTQIISVLSPDSVPTENDLIKKFSKEGKIYERFESNALDSGATNYFMDTLKISGSLFIKAFLPSRKITDSVSLTNNLVIYERTDTSSGTTFSATNGLYSLKNAGNQMRNDLQDMILSTKQWDIQGYVLSSNDSIILFRTTKNALLRQGTALRFLRGYEKGVEGLRLRLNDLKNYINYYKRNIADSDRVKGYLEDYSVIEKRLKQAMLPNSEFGGFATGIGIEGKVIEMYDSTGKAIWYKTESFPEKPKAGDIIYYR